MPFARHLFARRFVCVLMRTVALLFPVVAFLAPGAASAQTLPREVETALAQAQVPREAVALLVTDVHGQRPPRLAWRTQTPMVPASVMKLLTTYAGLDLLGPAFTWRTPVYVEGRVQGGTLEGNLYIEGRGDPKLVMERLWLLLRQVQSLGIRTIRGDIVLDRSAFEVGTTDPGAFDGRPLKSYNAAPDALLVNYKSVVLRFVPQPDAGVALIGIEPPLAGVMVQASVPLSAGSCEGWRTQLRASFQSERLSFAGSYPAGCPQDSWPVAYPQPDSFAARAIAGLWAEMGGQISGRVREGRVPAGLAPAFEAVSPSLAEVVRDINKFSNNVMAEQLFLTLGLQFEQHGSAEAARTVLRQWWSKRVGATEGVPAIDNGSGLSLVSRITAGQLGQMLQAAWRSPSMPELAASLPIVGVDGTLRKRVLRTGATAHLKSGSLPESGVTAVAGYVDGQSGRRYALVAFINHPHASRARAAFDALIDWTAQDMP